MLQRLQESYKKLSKIYRKLNAIDITHKKYNTLLEHFIKINRFRIELAKPQPRKQP